MPRQKNTVPTYRNHKASRRAFVQFVGSAGRRETLYLGPYGSPESREAYARLIVDLEAGRMPTPLAAVGGISVAELLDRWQVHAARRYANGVEAAKYAPIESAMLGLLEPAPVS